MAAPPTLDLLRQRSPYRPFQALAGIGNSLDNAASDTIIQRAVPAPMLGRVFGLMAAMAYAAAGLSAAIGGPLLDLTSPRFVFVVAGVGGLAVLILAAPALRRNERTPDPGLPSSEP